jgi:hypothetical protein
MAYHGDILKNLTDKKPFDFRFTNPGITFVQGGNLNPFGHALWRFGDDLGYIHVDEPLDYPKVIPAARFHEYLSDNGKFVLRTVDLKLPFANQSLLKIEELRVKQWIWGAIPHNCVTFCEQVAEAGGCDWSSITNLPYLATFFTSWSKEEAPQYAQAAMQVEGAKTLKVGESADYKLRTIGLPAGGSRRWWPGIGDEKDGLKTVRIFDGGVTVKATKSAGTAVVTVRYRYGSQESVGRLEVHLKPA